MEIKPWGHYEVILSELKYKVKRICINPKQRLSLQRHKFREEHWYVVSGECIIQINCEKYYLVAGDSIDIPVEFIHRVQNISNEILVIIETQRGNYLEEDDIERIEDDYGRM